MEHGKELPETATLLTTEQQQKIESATTKIQDFLNHLQQDGPDSFDSTALAGMIKESEEINDLLVGLITDVHSLWRNAVLTSMEDITKAGRALYQTLETPRSTDSQNISLQTKLEIKQHLEKLFQVYAQITILLGEVRW